jgi:hypothetical protein
MALANIAQPGWAVLAKRTRTRTRSASPHQSRRWSIRRRDF